MQKNGRRSIPDFSRKHPQKPAVPSLRSPTVAVAPLPAPAASPAMAHAGKPKATSVKSGRRGQ
jgi:hypothetical protein